MKIRSGVPENGCLIVLVDGKKNKKKNICKTYMLLHHQRLRKKNKKKTSVKYIRYSLIGGCVNHSLINKLATNFVNV